MDVAKHLIFQEEKTRLTSSTGLIGLILISLLAHAASFYLFQILYIPEVRLPLTSPVHFTVLPEGSTENAIVQQWLAIADPALAINSELRQSATNTLHQIPFSFEPSYQRRDTSESDSSSKLQPKSQKTLSTNSIIFPTPGLVPAPPQETTPNSSLKNTSLSSHPSAKSVVTLTNNLNQRLSKKQPLPPLTIDPTIKPPLIATFLIGVRPEGGQPFIFQEKAVALPPKASTAIETYLQQLSFEPSPESQIIWGQAVIQLQSTN